MTDLKGSLLNEKIDFKPSEDSLSRDEIAIMATSIHPQDDRSRSKPSEETD